MSDITADIVTIGGVIVGDLGEHLDLNIGVLILMCVDNLAVANLFIDLLGLWLAEHIAELFELVPWRLLALVAINNDTIAGVIVIDHRLSALMRLDGARDEVRAALFDWGPFCIALNDF